MTETGRRHWPGTRPAGWAGAAVVGAASLLPGLVPHSAPIQGLVTGVCAAIGYGLGTALGWLVTRLRTPSPKARRIARTVCGWLGGALALAALIAGWRWQIEQSRLVGTAEPTLWWVPATAAVAAAVFLLVLLIAAGVRRLTGWLADRLGSVLPGGVATASAVGLVAVTGLIAVDRTPNAVVWALTPMFARANAANAPGVAQPASPVVSGAPGSAVSWQDLGRDGRQFIAGVTPTTDLQSFSGRPAQDPIRVFVGIDSADTAEERAQLAVDDLERFGAFDRSVLALATGAGAGTIDPNEVAALEYVTDGDVATATTQYSLLPSFLSFLVDRPNSVTEASALLQAVRDRLAQLPEKGRPKLVVFGESLGAYGALGAFNSIPDLVDETTGAMFVGPPNSSPLWREATAEREPGSPEVLPVFDDGRHIRWADTADDLELPGAAWEPGRTVFLQNATDPVVWWTPSVIWSRPDWLAEPRGSGVLPWLPWIPLTTFAALTADMINSQGVPPGNGHMYGTDPVFAWADILQPAGWDEQDTERLEQQLGG